MKFHDITLPITSGMLTWEGDRKPQINRLKTIEKNGSAKSEIVLGSHAGTHVDAPAHFLENGAGVESFSPDVLIGECQVVDLTGIQGREITVLDIKSVGMKEGDRILFKTTNSSLLQNSEFTSDYVSLSAEAAQYLIENGVRLVGTDYLGIEKRGAEDHPTHKTLLSAGVVIVEGLNLLSTEEGRYELICAPLLIPGADGAPARVFLRDL